MCSHSRDPTNEWHLALPAPELPGLWHCGRICFEIPSFHVQAKSELQHMHMEPPATNQHQMKPYLDIYRNVCQRINDTRFCIFNISQNSTTTVNTVAIALRLFSVTRTSDQPHSSRSLKILILWPIEIPLDFQSACRLLVLELSRSIVDNTRNPRPTRVDRPGRLDNDVTSLEPDLARLRPRAVAPTGRRSQLTTHLAFHVRQARCRFQKFVGILRRDFSLLRYDSTVQPLFRSLLGNMMDASSSKFPERPPLRVQLQTRTGNQQGKVAGGFTPSWQ